MRELPLGLITLETLVDMKEAGVSEGRHLDFKRQLPGTNDEAKREFTADLCSFANAGGGDIVYGVDEAKDAAGKKTGAMGDLLGLADPSFEKTRQWMGNIAREGLDPRIPELGFQEIPGGTLGRFLVVRIARSFATPHMVKLFGLSRFYSRHSADKFQLDVREIRAAFSESEIGFARARNFRLERVAKIMTDDLPVRMSGWPRWSLHVIPVRHGWDATIDTTSEQLGTFRPMTGDGYSHRRNLDGLAAIAGDGSTTTRSYAQLFRDGSIEAVDTYLGVDDEMIFGAQLEKRIVEHARKYAGALRRIGITAPLAVFVSLLRVGNHSIVVERYRSPEQAFDRSEILLPEVIIETDEVTPEQLRLLFDVMWQASNWERSPSFNESGEWVPPRR